MPSVSQTSLSNADSKPFWDAAREHRLVFKKCKACGQQHFPPRYLCPKCWSEDAEWVQHSGFGQVHSFTIVHRAPTPAHAGKVPYVLAIVDMENAPRMVANIVGNDALEASIGAKVEVIFEPRGEDMIPQFRLCSPESAAKNPKADVRKGQS